MTSDATKGADPVAGVGLDLDEWDDAEDLDGIDAADEDGDSQATEEYGFGFSLWDGDEGTLEAMQRDALVVLLKHAYISSDTYPREWKTLVNSIGPIRSQLNNLYLDLVIRCGAWMCRGGAGQLPPETAPKVRRAQRGGHGQARDLESSLAGPGIGWRRSPLVGETMV